MNKVLKAASNPARATAILARRYLDWYSGFSYDFEKNGELTLIQNIRESGFKIVFDVGANVGDWSKRFLVKAPGANVHCFEISASTYGILVENIGDSAKCYNFGLSNVNSEIQYKDYGQNSTVNTISNDSAFWDSSLEYELKTTSVERGDDFCARSGIAMVDFLKIDVEGVENLVLEGFSGLLRQRKIRLVQFEYGYANGDQHFLMKDFFNFFEAFGYKVGVVRRQGVIFSDFHYGMNDFLSGPNYVAIRKDDADLEKRICI